LSVIAEVDADKKHILLTTDWRYKELCKSLPGASWSPKDQVWRAPLSWTTCL